MKTAPQAASKKTAPGLLPPAHSSPALAGLLQRIEQAWEKSAALAREGGDPFDYRWHGGYAEACKDISRAVRQCLESDLAHRHSGHTESTEIRVEASRPPCSVQRLVRLLEAVRTAKPWIKGFENMLASSLSSDSRSHDDDRQPRRDINAVLDALAECDKPN